MYENKESSTFFSQKNAYLLRNLAINCFKNMFLIFYRKECLIKVNEYILLTICQALSDNLRTVHSFNPYINHLTLLGSNETVAHSSGLLKVIQTVLGRTRVQSQAVWLQHPYTSLSWQQF